MKQLFVAIVVVLFSNFGAVAVDGVKITATQNPWRESWGFYNTQNNNYNSYSNYYTVKKNSNYGDFEYVNAVIATTIYEHGAVFCRMQLQHNFANWVAYIAPSSCRTFCQDGYYGARCDSSNQNDIVCTYDDDLKELFSSTAEPAPYSQTDIDNFLFDSSNRAYITVLSVPSNGIGQNYVGATPVYFAGYDDKYKEIETITKKSNQDRFKLCAPGYVKNTDGDCVRSTYCTGTSGGNGGGTSCPVTNKQGPNVDGECITCDGAREFYDSVSESCVEYNKILLKSDMVNGQNGQQECWKIPEREPYYDCVLPQ